MSFDQIAWLPLCGGLTAVGLVLSFLAFRRRGAASGLRLAAWSLIPVAAYLTGALSTLWKMGTAAVGFVTGLVFSPTVWAGVAVTGLAVVLYLVSGVMLGRGAARQRSGKKAAPESVPEAAGAPAVSAGAPTQPNRPPLPRRRPAAAAAAPADDDLSDIEEILKRRGIS